MRQTLLRAIVRPATTQTQFRLATCTRVVARPFSVAPRFALKEGADHSGEELERAKLEQKQKGNDGEGRDKLRSQSEEHIKADKEQIKDHDKHIKELQQEGARKGEQEKR